MNRIRFFVGTILLCFTFLSMVQGGTKTDNCVIKLSPSELQDTVLLRPILSKVRSNTTVSLPKGVYLLDLKSNPRALQFFNLKNVVIDGNGSEIICNKQVRALQFTNCTNLQFKNISIDYQPLCYTQGSITAISADRKKWTVKVHDGYPREGIDGGKMILYSSETKELKTNFFTFYSGFQCSAVDENGYMDISFANLNMLSGKAQPKIGDVPILAVVPNDGKSMPPHTIEVNSCTDILFERVNIYQSNSFSILEKFSTGCVYRNCVIDRKPWTELAKEKVPRYFAGCADGIHSKHAKLGPIIENCTIGHIGDDCIAINGTMFPIYKMDKANSVIYVLSKDRYSDIPVKKADKLIALDVDGTKLAKNEVVEVKGTSITQAEIQALFNTYRFGINQKERYTHGVAIKLTSWDDNYKLGTVFYAETKIGAGFKILNNKVGHTRSRGIIIKSQDGLLQGNTVDGCGMSAIVHSVEFTWMEGGVPANIEIKDNVFKNNMHVATVYGATNAATVSVTVPNGSGGGFVQKYLINNVTVSNNTFINEPYPCILMTSGTNMTQSNNNFPSKGTVVREHGKNQGVSNQNPVFTKYVKN